MSIEELIRKLSEWAVLGYTIAQSRYVKELYRIFDQENNQVFAFRVTNKCINKILQAAFKVQGHVKQIQSEMANQVKMGCDDLVIPQNMPLARQMMENFKESMPQAILICAFCLFLHLPIYHRFVRRTIEMITGLSFFSNDPKNKDLIIVDCKSSPNKLVEAVQGSQIESCDEKHAAQRPAQQNVTQTNQAMLNTNETLQAKQNLLSQGEEQIDTSRAPSGSKVKQTDQSMPQVGQNRLGGSGSAPEEFYKPESKRQKRDDLNRMQMLQRIQAIQSQHQQPNAFEQASFNSQATKFQRVPLTPSKEDRFQELINHQEHGLNLMKELKRTRKLRECANKQGVLLKGIEDEKAQIKDQLDQCETNIYKLAEESAQNQMLVATANMDIVAATSKANDSSLNLQVAVFGGASEVFVKQLFETYERDIQHRFQAEANYKKADDAFLKTAQEIEKLDCKRNKLVERLSKLSTDCEKRKLVSNQAEFEAAKSEQRLDTLLNQSSVPVKMQASPQIIKLIEDVSQIAEELDEDASQIIEDWDNVTLLINPAESKEPDFIDVDSIDIPETEAEKNANANDIEFVVKKSADVIKVETSMNSTVQIGTGKLKKAADDSETESADNEKFIKIESDLSWTSKCLKK